MPYPKDKYKGKNHWNYGKIPWNKGKKCPELMGNTRGFKKGQKPWITGRKHTEETKIKMRKPHWGRRGKIPTWRSPKSGFQKGEKHWNWRGGVSQERELLKNKKEEKIWAKKVKDRDNWTCRKCGAKKDLIAHHIELWTPNSENNYDVKNGIALCRSCHRKLHWELRKKRANSVNAEMPTPS